MTNEEFGQFMRERIKKWVVSILKYLRTLPNSAEVRVIRFQLIKSATSTGANYRAACRARSNNEFHAKLSISVEACDESVYWLEIIEASDIDNSDWLKQMRTEGEQILAILVKARKNTKRDE